MNVLGFTDRLVEKGFNDAQIQEIVAGIEADVDVHAYCKLEFDAKQMHEIRLGLEHDIPVTTFAKPELSADQMWIIRHVVEGCGSDLGLSGDVRHMFAEFFAVNVDPTLTEVTDLSSDKLMLLAEAKRAGFGFASIPYTELDDEQVHELFLAKVAGIDEHSLLVRDSNGDFLDARKMKQIRLALKNDIDLSSACSYDLSASQLKEVRFCLEEKMNAGVIASGEYSAAQMRQIRLGMHSGLDVSVYADAEKYSAEFMRLIRQGLAEGIVLTRYAIDGKTLREASDLLQSLLHQRENMHDAAGGIELNEDFVESLVN